MELDCSYNELLTQHRVRLVRGLTQNITPVLDYLIQTRDLSPEESHHVEAQLIPEDKVRKLLDLLDAKGSTAFNSFRAALRQTGNQQLACLLGEDESGDTVLNIDSYEAPSTRKSEEKRRFRLFRRATSSVIFRIFRRPPDRSVVSAISCTITNIELVLSFLLLLNDILYTINLNITDFSIFEHVMLLISLCQFFYCEPRVKTNSKLSRAAEEKHKLLEEGYETVRKELQEIDYLRSKIAQSLRNAILVTLLLEIAVTFYILTAWYSDMKSDFFGAVFTIFVCDLIFNVWIFSRYYHCVQVKLLNRRFVVYRVVRRAQSYDVKTTTNKETHES